MTYMLASAVCHHEYHNSASASARELIPIQLVINAKILAIHSHSNLHMLRTLTNKLDDEASNCWSNVDGNEILNAEAE